MTIVIDYSDCDCCTTTTTTTEEPEETTTTQEPGATTTTTTTTGEPGTTTTSTTPEPGTTTEEPATTTPEPAIDPSKWYCVWTSYWYDWYEIHCQDPADFNGAECLLGSQIQVGVCQGPDEMDTYWRHDSINGGPYDDWESCFEVCGVA